MTLAAIKIYNGLLLIPLIIYLKGKLKPVDFSFTFYIIWCRFLAARKWGEKIVGESRFLVRMYRCPPGRGFNHQLGFGGITGGPGLRLSWSQADLNPCPTDLCPESNNRWTRAGSPGDYFRVPVRRESNTNTSFITGDNRIETFPL